METAIAGAGGLARGGLTAAAGYAAAVNLLGKAFRSTGWRTVSAATKLSIADALSSGNFGKIPELLGQAGLTGIAASKAAETPQGNQKQSLSSLLSEVQMNLPSNDFLWCVLRPKLLPNQKRQIGHMPLNRQEIVCLERFSQY
jgi:hypothetical protein